MGETLALYMTEKKITEIREEILVPNSQLDRFTVTYYAGDEALVSLTTVGMTNSRFGVVIVGNRFIEAVLHIYKVINAWETAKEGVSSSVLWENHVAPYLISAHKGIKRDYFRY